MSEAVETLETLTSTAWQVPGCDAACAAAQKEICGRYVFVIARAEKQGMYLDESEEKALVITGNIALGHGEGFHAIIHPRHPSQHPVDEEMPEIRRMVMYQHEVDEARVKLRAAGLTILSEGIG